MDDADKIVNKIFSWMDLQKDSVDKLNELASELEEQQKTINVTKVVGSSVSVGGAAAMTVAGVVSVLTGGLSIPLLAGTGAVASGLGLATSVGSDVVGAVLSSRTMKEAQNISKSLDDLTAEITALMESLLTKATGRQQRGKNVSPEEYVKEAILRAMAKRKGLILKEKDSLIKLLSQLPLEKIFKNDAESDLLKKSTTEVPLLSDFVTGLVSEKLMKNKVSKANSLGLKASTTAVGKVSIRKPLQWAGLRNMLDQSMFVFPEPLIRALNNILRCELTFQYKIISVQ